MPLRPLVGIFQTYAALCILTYLLSLGGARRFTPEYVLSIWSWSLS